MFELPHLLGFTLLPTLLEAMLAAGRDHNSLPVISGSSTANVNHSSPKLKATGKTSYHGSTTTVYPQIQGLIPPLFDIAYLKLCFEART